MLLEVNFVGALRLQVEFIVDISLFEISFIDLNWPRPAIMNLFLRSNYLYLPVSDVWYTPCALAPVFFPKRKIIAVALSSCSLLLCF